VLTTIHNKLVNTHTEDLKPWWKIFHAAQEDWTVASDNWEGTSWGYFTGDDEAMKSWPAASWRTCADWRSTRCCGPNEGTPIWRPGMVCKNGFPKPWKNLKR
jgi:hypothetical protein